MNDFKFFESLNEFILFRNSSMQNKTIGLVPTMGALHTGHASLLQRSADENDLTVLSLYINPTQFNNADDLKKYPRSLDADIDLAKKNGARIVISPHYEEIYADKYRFRVSENNFSKVLCGAHRPGHFDGVLTIVLKLLQLTKATKAYFGEKDFQQLKLIKDMVASFFIDTEVVACATVREKDGLALSSRNLRLTEAGRKLAPAIYQAIAHSTTIQEAAEKLRQKNIEVEYLEEHYNRRFIAAFIDQVRLIDNVKI